ncbi:hypothetical protein [Petrocella sp. FN5]|uniref:hypothetical protein n=1 Tax=Petrocella sp. FN5 TaxID=3032002 RepID=UPI0023DB35E5|nr:hypothetical protein [Petrocella sp. FN5]MDF1618787.1 hypothetical protein [Petrocella sp. FN5]
MRLVWGYIWRTIVIGLLSFLALVIAGILITVFKLPMPVINGDTNYIFIMIIMSGAAISILLGIITQNLRLFKLMVFGAVFLFLYLNYVTQIMEALYFVPGVVTWEVLPTILLQQLVMAIMIATGVVFLYKRKESSKSKPLYNRGLLDWIFRIVISIGSYVAFYYLFGRLNAFLFTEGYYLSQIDGLYMPSGNVILVLEIVRATLIVISILPIILFLELPVKKVMILSGLSLFVLGGLLPMLQQIGSLPMVLIITSSVEMFFQFFLTAVVTTLAMHYGDKEIRSEYDFS